MALAEEYFARAISAKADAEASNLENVKARCLRSAAAWHEMAISAQRVETLRSKREADAAARAKALASDLKNSDLVLNYRIWFD